MRRLRPAALLVLLVGCSAKSPTPFDASPPTRVNSPSAALFEDVAARVGVKFTHTNGANGRFYFIEFSPAGCALFDYDNDGWLDILLIQSGPSEKLEEVDAELAQASMRGKRSAAERAQAGGEEEGVAPEVPGPKVQRPFCALYRNNGDATFTDVTTGSGLDRDLGYAQGVAVGDYDNDGWDDLFITAYGGNHLFRNVGGERQSATVQSGVAGQNRKSTIETRRFEDVTAAMGLDRVHSTGYATSAAWGDYDNDGRLDLYVCYYGPWTWDIDRPCHNAQGQRDYCAPRVYDPDTHRLYRNAGHRFVDVSERAGIAKARGRGLAVAWVDYDEDGWQDIYVVNDLNAAFLWRNNGNGTFTETAIRAGCAFAEGGDPMAGMGIAVADYDHSGRESLFVTNFSGQPNTLFQNIGHGLFEDVSLPSGLALPHINFLAFGCEFLDYDADGWRDLLLVNGHVHLYPEVLQEGVTYKQRKQLFHNEGKGTFREVTDRASLGDLAVPTVGRGLAVGDFDNDGRLDALVNNQNGPAQLFRNRDRTLHHWVAFQTIGTKSNRNGIHARFTLTAGGVRQVATVRGGSSYLSYSDRRVYFGLGSAARIEKVVIQWPSGLQETLRDVKPDTTHVITEGRGITGRVPVRLP